MVEHRLDHLELKEPSLSIRLVRQGNLTPAPAPTAPAPFPTPSNLPAESPPPPEVRPIPSPIAGIFYRASSPSSPPFVKEGDRLQQGQTLCLVEAMKVFNEIKAETAGVLVKILVENGKPVKNGQTLFWIQAGK